MSVCPQGVLTKPVEWTGMVQADLHVMSTGYVRICIETDGHMETEIHIYSNNVIYYCGLIFL